MTRQIKKSSQWTPDEQEFDQILTLMESPRQLERIDGRLAYSKFEARFTPEQLAEMAKHIGAKKAK